MYALTYPVVRADTFPPESKLPVGKQLRKLRTTVGLSTREVERRSSRIVESRHNPEFLVTHSWLRSIEEGRNLHTPSGYKFYTLSAAYNRSNTELASYFGVPFIAVGALMGGEDIVHEYGTHSGNLVRGDGRSYSAATESHSPLNLSRRDGPRRRNDEVWVVISGVQFVRAEVHDFVRRAA